MKFEKVNGMLLFRDVYSVPCVIQRSSVGNHIWLGTQNPNPKQLASKVIPGATGWVNYHMPEDILIHHRMHLSPKQAISLGWRLIRYGFFNKL